MPVDPASLPAAGRPSARESINDTPLSTAGYAPRRVTEWRSTHTHGMKTGEFREVPIYRQYHKPDYPFGQTSTRDIDGAMAGTVSRILPLSGRMVNPLQPAYSLPALRGSSAGGDPAAYRAPRDPLRLDDISGTRAVYVDHLNPQTKDVPHARGVRALERDTRSDVDVGRLGLWAYGDSGHFSRSRRHVQTPSNPLQPVYRYDGPTQEYDASCYRAAAARRAAIPARAALTKHGGGPEGELQGNLERMRASVAGPYGKGVGSVVMEGKLVLTPTRRTHRFGKGGLKNLHHVRAPSTVLA